LLLGHPLARLCCATSRQHEGVRIDEAFLRFRGMAGAELAFSGSSAEAVVAAESDVALLALPHGLASEFARPLLDAGVRVIDLSADFRIHDAAVYADFYGEEHPAPELLPEAVYGLPELHREEIRRSKLIASPGCYPTSVLVPLAPLLRVKLIDPATITVCSLSGVSGAGRRAELEYSFVECNENGRPYGVPKHRHLGEIEQELSLAAGETVVVQFIPHLVPWNRGILTTITASVTDAAGADAIDEVMEEAYGEEPCVRLRGRKAFVEVKDVAGTNFIDLAWRSDPRTGRVVLMSAEDNLLKGAAGQAVQSLNLICGWPETCGLL
jgi:N-acetyl-gamma-glutamyl-phosphate reductase